MALYRLPFPEEDGQTWFVQNGGWDQGGHAAGQGDKQSHRRAGLRLRHRSRDGRQGPCRTSRNGDLAR